MPLHWFSLQSPGACTGVGVPAGANENPQVLLIQVRVWQSLSWPGQVEAVKQPTQEPFASHTWLPPQEVPAGKAGFEGTPLVQTSLVQTLLSTGRSASLFTTVTPPMPLHWFSLQSPPV